MAKYIAAKYDGSRRKERKEICLRSFCPSVDQKADNFLNGTSTNPLFEPDLKVAYADL